VLSVVRVLPRELLLDERVSSGVVPRHVRKRGLSHARVKLDQERAVSLVDRRPQARLVY
jgi:hypothetical protein